MKRIVLCFDGTWNSPADDSLAEDLQVETNVSRFHRSVADTGADGVGQVKWYNEGVGVRWYNNIAGGVFGIGLDQHILDGYRYLVDTYEEGDEVFILGFSRGAYTARSLVGMIRNCGLVMPNFAWLRIGMAYGIYRTRDDGPDSAAAKGFRELFSREIEIRFLGVWDTVGALGIPLHFVEGLNLAVYRFHDTRLSSIVKNAYHAVAIDEHREDFKVSLWDPAEAPQQTIEQRWFVGAHSDVGGGYPNRQLSDLSLLWMQDRAATLGLGLHPVTLATGSFRGPITDSYSQFLNGLYAQVRPRYHRRILSMPFGNEILDPSVALRRRAADLEYQPGNDGLPALES